MERVSEEQIYPNTLANSDLQENSLKSTKYLQGEKEPRKPKEPNNALKIRTYICCKTQGQQNAFSGVYSSKVSPFLPELISHSHKHTCHINTLYICSLYLPFPIIQDNYYCYYFKLYLTEGEKSTLFQKLLLFIIKCN